MSSVEQITEVTFCDGMSSEPMEFFMAAGTILYAQSGGVTAVINATASAVLVDEI